MTCAIIGFIISYLFVILTVGNSVDITGEPEFTLTEKLQASFLIFLDCRELHLSQDKLVDFFVDKAHLALNDGAMFGKEGEGFMRLNVACPRSVLRQALDQIKEAYELKHDTIA